MLDAHPDKTLRPFARRVKIRNYKSIGHCHVELRPLTVLVGRNGSGKSNFLDALHFITDSLQTSLDHAIKARGGIDDVRRRSTGHPRNFAVEVEFAMPDLQVGTYGFEIASRGKGGFAVKWERLRVARGARLVAHFKREGTVVDSSVPNPPPVLEDRLYLVNAAGLPDFRPAFDALLSMGFYNLNPNAIRELQNPDPGDLLHDDGGNIASVVERLNQQRPEAVERICTYLQTIVPDITEIDRVALGPRETLLFKQRVKGAEHPWKFYASSMSDGTLRALGALVAVTQLSNGSQPVRLVGIEEPETALHPAAAGALMDALREASLSTQVLVTSHSPDLLDQVNVEEDGLLVVQSVEGNTRIAPVDPASVQALQEHLYSPGELLRMDQLAPDEDDLARQEQIDLFAEPAAAS